MKPGQVEGVEVEDLEYLEGVEVELDQARGAKVGGRCLGDEARAGGRCPGGGGESDCLKEVQEVPKVKYRRCRRCRSQEYEEVRR